MSDAASPAERLRPLESRATRLATLRAAASSARASLEEESSALDAWLALAPEVADALDELSRALFAQVTQALETALSDALRDVLDESIRVKVEQEWRRGGAAMTFTVERRPGEREEIMTGQGGSVANILSTGLRIFALARLDPARHRRFVVLDEQDCWLRPDVIHRFVRLVDETARRLGFQVLMISHHDPARFVEAAERVYRLEPVEEDETEKARGGRRGKKKAGEGEGGGEGPVIRRAVRVVPWDWRRDPE